MVKALGRIGEKRAVRYTPHGKSSFNGAKRVDQAMAHAPWLVHPDPETFCRRVLSRS
jgi:hypothetical protein